MKSGFYHIVRVRRPSIYEELFEVSIKKCITEALWVLIWEFLNLGTEAVSCLCMLTIMTSRQWLCKRGSRVLLVRAVSVSGCHWCLSGVVFREAHEWLNKISGNCYIHGMMVDGIKWSNFIFSDFSCLTWFVPVLAYLILFNGGSTFHIPHMHGSLVKVMIFYVTSTPLSPTYVR